MKTIMDFAVLYRLYRCHHGRRYAAKRAWGIAVKGLPF